MTDSAERSVSGLNLLQIALTESQGDALNSQAFSRQTHIDGLAYLLRGLPNNLTEQEAQIIHNALPDSVAVNVAQAESKPRTNPSLLHRGLASSVILACFIVNILLPYIKSLFATAYRYERTHHITERIFVFSVNTADSLGKKTMEFASNTLGHDFVIASIAYCIDGVRGGLTEGFGRGLKVIEAPQGP